MEYEKPPLPEEASREHIGARIRLTRKALNITPTFVCSELGMRRSTWSMNEAGNSLPNPLDMIRFCDRFGASLDWIYRGKMNGLSHELASAINALLKKQNQK